MKWLLVLSLVLSNLMLLAKTTALPINAAHAKVTIFIRDDVLNDYHAFLAGRDPLQISSFKAHHIRRDVVDMIIAQQALALGGYNKVFNYHPGKINFRNTKMLEQGELLLSFDTYWQADAQALADSVFISDDVIRNGEYIAGIFAHPSNEAVFKVKTLADLQLLSAVSTSKWRTDWLTLQSLNLERLQEEHEWLSQARMVHLKWVDFMLMPLMPELDNHYRLEQQIELKAVPGIAIQLNDSRHFVVSKHHPDGEAAFAALQKGLRLLRAQGKITTAYQEAGFIPAPGTVTILNAQ